MSTALTTVEHDDLAACERVIESGLQTFVDVGQALLCVRDRRLYREQHSTFEDYCRERWAMSRVHAHRTIEAAQVAAVLPMGNTPASERVARELAPVIRLHGPDVAAEVWDVLTVDGAQPTAAQTREAVQSLPRDKPPDVPLRDYVAEAIARKPAHDLTFMAISDAAERLRDRDPESLWLPPDRGNIDALDRDLGDLMDWLGRFAVVWATHKRETQEAA